jgi:hypothetical protein
MLYLSPWQVGGDCGKEAFFEICHYGGWESVTEGVVARKHTEEFVVGLGVLEMEVGIKLIILNRVHYFISI